MTSSPPSPSSPPPGRDELVVRLVTVIALAVILLAAVIGIIITALTTDRDLWRAEAATLAGGVLLAALGGLTGRAVRRRRRWRIERNGDP